MRSKGGGVTQKKMKGEGESHSVSRHHGPRATCHVRLITRHESFFEKW